jgi:ribonuclease HI
MDRVEGRCLKKIGQVYVYTDAASRGNPGPAAISYSIYDEHANIVESDAKRIENTTNNSAEYQALIWAMERASEYTDQGAVFYSDSELLVNQIRGDYRVRNERLAVLFDKVVLLRGRFDTPQFVHRPRHDPRISLEDDKVNAVLDGKW